MVDVRSLKTGNKRRKEALVIAFVANWQGNTTPLDVGLRQRGRFDWLSQKEKTSLTPVYFLIIGMRA